MRPILLKGIIMKLIKNIAYASIRTLVFLGILVFVLGMLIGMIF